MSQISHQSDNSVSSRPTGVAMIAAIVSILAWLAVTPLWRLLAQPRGQTFEVRVVDAATGLPVAGARVAIGSVASVVPPSQRFRWDALHEDGRPDVGSAADEFGRFALDVEDRRSSIYAMAPGFLLGAYGQVWPGGPAQSLPIGPGGSRNEIVVHLWPMASLAGRVEVGKDEEAGGLRVDVIPLAASRFVQLTSGTISTTTQADGTFRVDSLAPGRYRVGVLSAVETIRDSGVRRSSPEAAPGRMISGVVRVGPQVVAVSNGVPRVSKSAGLSLLRTVFYPGGDTLDAAESFLLQPGEARQDVTLTMRRSSTTTVSGRVEAMERRRLNGSLVRLVPIGSHVLGSVDLAIAKTTLDEDGSFLLHGVPPGQYEIRATVPGTSQPYTRRATEGRHKGMPTVGSVITAAPYPEDRVFPLYAQTPVNVGREPVTGIVLDANEGPRIEGDVSWADDPQRVLPDNVSVVVRPIDGMGSAQMWDAKGGYFITTPLEPGRYAVEVNGTRSLTWQVLAGGVDRSSDAFDVTSGRVSVSIQFDSRTQAVTGKLITSPESLSVARAFLFPRSRWKWSSVRLSERQFRTVPVEADGKFAFADVPPDEYLVSVVRAEPLSLDWREPEMLEQLASVGKLVALRMGERKAVYLGR